MFCTFTLALPAVCVQRPIRLFLCSSLISCFPCTLLRYCLSDLEMAPVAPIIAGSLLLLVLLRIFEHLNEMWAGTVLPRILAPNLNSEFSEINAETHVKLQR